MHWLKAPRSELSGVVGNCREFVGSCRELLELVGRNRECGIAIVVDKISAEFPIPEILRSVPEAGRGDEARMDLPPLARDEDGLCVARIVRTFSHFFFEDPENRCTFSQ